MKKGKFIVFEGISGTGKETQAKLLLDYLKKKGIKTQIVYHPSLELKEVLSRWRKNRNIDNITEAYLLLADRYDMVRRIIKPALSQGEYVISLRNFVSALVYQAKNETDRDFMRKEFRWFEPEPDMLFYFDLTPDEALSRINKRHEQTGENYGKFETQENLKIKLISYRTVMKEITHIKIDAGNSIDEIHNQIRNHLHPLFN